MQPSDRVTTVSPAALTMLSKLTGFLDKKREIAWPDARVHSPCTKLGPYVRHHDLIISVMGRA